MTGGPDPPGKSQMAEGFLRNFGMDPLENQSDPLGPIASRGRSIWPSVKYFDDLTKKRSQDPLPDGIFWICACLISIFTTM